MQFCQVLRQLYAADELSVHTILWIGECFMLEGVFSVHNSHISARDNPRVVRIMWASSPLQRQHCGWYRRGHYSWLCTCYLTGWLTAQWYHSLLETVLPMLTDMFQATRHILWFYRDGPAAHYRQDVPLWLKSTYSGRWSGSGGWLRAVAGCSFDGVFFSTLDGAWSYISPHDQDRVARPASW